MSRVQPLLKLRHTETTIPASQLQAHVRGAQLEQLPASHANADRSACLAAETMTMSPMKPAQTLMLKQDSFPLH